MKPLEAFLEIDKFIFKSRASEDVHIKSAIGALGIRTDGAIIRSVNGSIRNSYAQSNATQSTSAAKSSIYHAEGRLLRKIDSGAVIYVASIILLMLIIMEFTFQILTLIRFVTSNDQAIFFQ
mgnify:CR=1 FL=1